MASVNKVILIGNLGRDPEVRYMPNGDAVANLNLATTEKWKDKNDQPQERVEWHRITCFGKTAENCAKYLEKGRSVYIEGRIQTREYQDKEDNKRWITEIIANNVQFLGDGKGGRRGDDAPLPDDNGLGMREEPEPVQTSGGDPPF